MSTMKKQFIGECSKLRIVELTDYLRFHMYFCSPANIVSFLFMAGESKKMKHENNPRNYISNFPQRSFFCLL